jgi:oligopeptide transport system substrate-binding protein
MDAPGNLVGNGAFTLFEWKPNQLIRVKRNPTYWDAAQVRLQEAFFYPIESEDAEERSFRSGMLHATATLPISKIAVYERTRTVSTIRTFSSAPTSTAST